MGSDNGVKVEALKKFSESNGEPYQVVIRRGSKGDRCRRQ